MEKKRKTKGTASYLSIQIDKKMKERHKLSFHHLLIQNSPQKHTFVSFYSIKLHQQSLFHTVQGPSYGWNAARPAMKA